MRAFDYKDGKIDYFQQDRQSGQTYAGTHLLLEFWETDHLDNQALIERALRGGALRAGATILHGHFHVFEPSGGITGVLLLAESHISIHSWPEIGYAAIDIFMCGDCDPRRAADYMAGEFRPPRQSRQIIRRGVLPPK